MRPPPSTASLNTYIVGSRCLAAKSTRRRVFVGIDVACAKRKRLSYPAYASALRMFALLSAVLRLNAIFVVLLSFHSFVRPAPRAFFPDRIFPSPSRAVAMTPTRWSGSVRERPTGRPLNGREGQFILNPSRSTRAFGGPALARHSTRNRVRCIASQPYSTILGAAGRTYRPVTKRAIMTMVRTCIVPCIPTAKKKLRIIRLILARSGSGRRSWIQTRKLVGSK
jgi:hypothetical protein